MVECLHHTSERQCIDYLLVHLIFNTFSIVYNLYDTYMSRLME